MYFKLNLGAEGAGTFWRFLREFLVYFKLKFGAKVAILKAKVANVWGPGGEIPVQNLQVGCNIQVGWGGGGERSELGKVIKQVYDFGSP